MAGRKDYPALFGAKYPIAQRWGHFAPAHFTQAERCVLLDACDFLFALNRYTKHDACTPRQRAAIYTEKNRLLRGLFLAGYCVRAYPAATPTYEGMCFTCDGTGGIYDAEDDWDEECWKCHGTGVYRSGGRPYWTFHFLLPLPAPVPHHAAGLDMAPRHYSWHQPAYLAEPWAHAVGAPPIIQKPVLVERNQPTGLHKRRIPAAIAHLHWVADNLEIRYPVPARPLQRAEAALAASRAHSRSTRLRFDWLPAGGSVSAADDHFS